MPYVCRARDAAGRIIFDANERLACLMDVFDTGKSAGARSYDPRGRQITFTVCAPLSNFYDGPAIYQNGNTISWDFNSNPTTGYSVKLLVWAF